MKLDERLIEPEPNSGCHIWIGPWRDGRGYGTVKVDGRNVYAHRIAWEERHGPIPVGFCALHNCDTPPCVNDAHLFLGTKADNLHDCMAKGRHRHSQAASNAAHRAITHCPQGHPYAGDNLVLYDGDHRKCRICCNLSSRDAKRRRAALRAA